MKGIDYGLTQGTIRNLLGRADGNYINMCLDS